MSENFSKIKRKYFIIAVIASVVLGVCCGVALTCTLAVIFKRCAVGFFWALYIPVAIVLSGGFAALFFFLLRPTDIKIAKKLDKDYSLNQKVQTMVEYAGVEGAMPALQREQTDEALGEVAKKRVDLSWLLKFLAIPVLALAMLFCGIFVPAVKSSGDRPFDITEGQEVELKKLIANVQASALDDGVKASEVEILNGLLDGLKKAQQQSVMKAAVISAVKMTDALIASANSYLKIHSALKTDENLSKLTTAVISGVIFYKDGTRITSYDGVKSRDKDAEEKIGQILQSWNTKFLNDYFQDVDAQIVLTVSQAAEKLESYSGALQRGLRLEELSAYAPEEGETSSDALYAALAKFAATLDELSANSRDYNKSETYLARIESAGTAFVRDAGSAVHTQSYYCMMDEYIRNTLARIFNLSASEIGTNESVAPDKVENNRDPNGGDGPNSDVGGTDKYGSDDLVLDVDSLKAEKYGKLLQKYEKIMNEFLSKPGEYSDEVEIYIRQYFQILYHGLEDEEN